MLRCVSLRVLAASCSLPPSGGRPRAAARCAALRRGRGLLRCFGRCGGLAFRSAGGAAPRAVAPPSRRRACSPSGCCASLRPRSPSCCARAALLLPPSRSPAAALVAAVAARRTRSLAPAARRRLRRRRRSSAWGRRGAPQRPLFPRLSALGGFAASFPLRVARRLSPPCGFGSGRPRRASAPLRRLAAVGRPRGGLLAAAAAAAFCGALRPPRGVWGLRRCGGAFFAAAAARCFARAARLPCLRLRPPSRAASRAARRDLASPRAARPPCLRLRLPSRADGRAKAARPFCAFGAFVVQGENWMQGTTASATYCADYSLDIPYTGEFGKTRIILPNYLWILSIDTAPHFWYAHIRNRGGRYGLYGCAAGAARLFDLS